MEVDLKGKAEPGVGVLAALLGVLGTAACRRGGTGPGGGT